MTKLYAQPFDVSATGFYFDDAADYAAKFKALKNDYGDPVEEFEIQFIDGELIDCEFAKALGLSQANLVRFFELVDEWEEHEKTKFIITVGEGGYAFDIEADDLNQLEVDIYEEDSLKDLAVQFVEEGYFGDVPDNLRFYLDYDAVALDLGYDGYTETTIAEQRLIFRCG